MEVQLARDQHDEAVERALANVLSEADACDCWKLYPVLRQAFTSAAAMWAFVRRRRGPVTITGRA
jgi:hypothetical protein